MTIFDKQESKVRSYSNHFPIVFSQAKGSWIVSENGEQYLDFLSGAGSLNYGHNNEELKKALVDYILEDGIAHGLDMHTKAKEAFLKALDQFIFKPRNLDYKVQFTGPTGTNAIEAAMKLARKITNRTNIVTFTNGFHGCTLGALCATGNQHHRKGAGVALSNITRLPYDGYANIDGLALFEAMLLDNSSGLDKPAAVLVEMVQGEGGLNVASIAWIKKLNRICQDNKILLIVDDIQAGCGRTGTFFSFEQAQIKPDIITLSKSISGYGLPMALVLLKPELDKWLPGEHNGTFRGNNHAFITATKAIECYWADNRFEKHILKCSSQINSALEQMLSHFSDLFIEQKGRGMMQGIKCKNEEIARAIARSCFDKGMLLETAGPNDEVLKFFCPLTISLTDLELGMSIFKQAVVEIANTMTKKAS